MDATVTRHEMATGLDSYTQAEGGNVAGESNLGIGPNSI